MYCPLSTNPGPFSVGFSSPEPCDYHSYGPSKEPHIPHPNLGAETQVALEGDFLGHGKGSTTLRSQIDWWKLFDSHS